MMHRDELPHGPQRSPFRVVMASFVTSAWLKLFLSSRLFLFPVLRVRQLLLGGVRWPVRRTGLLLS